jgi:O-antigen ligase
MALVAILQFRPGFDLTDWLAKIPLLTPNGDLTAVSTRGGFARPAGTALHPIEFGVIAGTALAFGAHLAIYDRATPRRFRLGPLVLIAFAIPISISRSALLTAGIVLIWFVAGATAPVRRRTLIALAATLSTVFMLIPGLIGTLRGFVFAGSNDSSISSRTSDFAAVASDLRASPWVGRGPGTYLPTYRILDNQYLLTLVEVGILGLIGLVAVLGVPAVLGRNARRMSTDEADRSLGQSFAGAGVALLAAAATFDALSFPTFTLLAALWVGLAGAWWAAIASTGSVSPEASRHTASRAGGR